MKQRIRFQKALAAASNIRASTEGVIMRTASYRHRIVLAHNSLRPLYSCGMRPITCPFFFFVSAVYVNPSNPPSHYSYL
jgi:hypothetical protein